MIPFLFGLVIGAFIGAGTMAFMFVARTGR